MATEEQIVAANPLDLVVGEDANADRWVFSGTHRGEFLGLAATGRRIEVEGATFSRFDAAGLVVEDVNFWDVPSLLAQLGANRGPVLARMQWLRCSPDHRSGSAPRRPGLRSSPAV